MRRQEKSWCTLNRKELRDEKQLMMDPAGEQPSLRGRKGVDKAFLAASAAIALLPWLSVLLWRTNGVLSLLVMLIGCTWPLLLIVALIATMILLRRGSVRWKYAALGWAVFIASTTLAVMVGDDWSRALMFRWNLPSFKAGLRASDLDYLPAGTQTKDVEKRFGAYTVRVQEVAGQRVLLLETPSGPSLETTIYSRRALPVGSMLDDKRLELVLHDETGYWFFVEH